MARMNRRAFIGRSLAAAGALAALPRARLGAGARVIGANDRIGVAVAGLNGQGSSHLGEFAKRDDVEVRYLVDPDTAVLDERLPIAKKEGHDPRTVRDVRRALEDKDLDCISIAAPNHWHSLMTIWACQAGKHVYVEKPCSHDVHEGRIAVHASRKYGVIVQHGTQQRCSAGRASLMKAIHDGQFGKLLVSHGYCCKARGSIGTVDSPQKPPATVDYDLWCGPAPLAPLMRRRFHYDWHWFWDTGNGDIGNQGVHEMDVARWALSGQTLPARVMSLGGRFGWDDSGQTPNSQFAILEFPNGERVFFTVRNLNYEGYLHQVKNDFHFEDCRLVDGKLYRKGSGDAEPFSLPRVEVTGGGRMGSFLAAVRAGKRETCNADILEGHYSSALCHIANVSYRLAENAPFNEKAGRFGDDAAAYEAFMEMHEILRDGCKLPVDRTEYRVGPWLTFDPETERFVGDRAGEANALLLPEYRKGYEVPSPATV